MLINFDRMDDTVLEHFKGGEGTFAPKMFSDTHNKILRGRLLPHSSIGLQTHEGNSEIILILSGTGKVLYEGDTIALKAGDTVLLPAACPAISLVGVGRALISMPPKA